MYLNSIKEKPMHLHRPLKFFNSALPTDSNQLVCYLVEALVLFCVLWASECVCLVFTEDFRALLLLVCLVLSAGKPLRSRAVVWVPSAYVVSVCTALFSGVSVRSGGCAITSRVVAVKRDDRRNDFMIK